uniref:Uncharacterized protein n=1 Tax=Rhizophagus irregularis (strain DAOM 181602 / DAOM 197198 / MUCL 43194) TaxID=747089 RepID=U9T6I2_RHIID
MACILFFVSVGSTVDLRSDIVGSAVDLRSGKGFGRNLQIYRFMFQDLGWNWVAVDIDPSAWTLDANILDFQLDGRYLDFLLSYVSSWNRLVPAPVD